MDSLEEKILLELGDLKRENDSLKATNERLVKGIELAIENCSCSINERISGHRTDCYVPELEEVLKSTGREG